MKRDALLAAQVDFRFAIRRFYIGCPWMDRKMASGLIEDPPPVVRSALYNTAVVTRILLDLHFRARRLREVLRKARLSSNPSVE